MDKDHEAASSHEFQITAANNNIEPPPPPPPFDLPTVPIIPQAPPAPQTQQQQTGKLPCCTPEQLAKLRPEQWCQCGWAPPQTQYMCPPKCKSKAKRKRRKAANSGTSQAFNGQSQGLASSFLQPKPGKVHFRPKSGRTKPCLFICPKHCDLVAPNQCTFSCPKPTVKSYRKNSPVLCPKSCYVNCCKPCCTNPCKQNCNTCGPCSQNSNPCNNRCAQSCCNPCAQKTCCNPWNNPGAPSACCDPCNNCQNQNPFGSCCDGPGPWFNNGSTYCTPLYPKLACHALAKDTPCGGGGKCPLTKPTQPSCGVQSCPLQNTGCQQCPSTYNCECLLKELYKDPCCSPPSPPPCCPCIPPDPPPPPPPPPKLEVKPVLSVEVVLPDSDVWVEDPDDIEDAKTGVTK